MGGSARQRVHTDTDRFGGTSRDRNSTPAQTGSVLVFQWRKRETGYAYRHRPDRWGGARGRGDEVGSAHRHSRFGGSGREEAGRSMGDKHVRKLVGGESQSGTQQARTKQQSQILQG